jgi:hypothetical protein
LRRLRGGATGALPARARSDVARAEAGTDIGSTCFLKEALGDARPTDQEQLDDSTLTARAMAIALRWLAPPDRHAMISVHFDTLQPRQSQELVNDHDPQHRRVRFAGIAFG